MPSAFARSNSGCTPGFGMARSKWASSAAPSISQRGKKVVKASSGKTASVAPRDAARSSKATMRDRVPARLSAFWVGPIWAAAILMTRLIVRASRQRLPVRQGSGDAHETCISRGACQSVAL